MRQDIISERQTPDIDSARAGHHGIVVAVAGSAEARPFFLQIFTSRRLQAPLRKLFAGEDGQETGPWRRGPRHGGGGDAGMNAFMVL